MLSSVSCHVKLMTRHSAEEEVYLVLAQVVTHFILCTAQILEEQSL